MTSSSEGVSIDGVYVGKEIAPGLFAEDVASCRWLIRRRTETGFAQRVGEVMGSQSRFQACRMNGDHVAMRPSLIAAAQALAA